jgi:apolipoprotein N-acyltransferase
MNRGRLGAGVGAGVCLALAMPPWDLAPLGLGTFALLALALHRAAPREAAAALWAGGLAAFALTGPWLIETVRRFTGVPWTLAALAHVGACAWMALAWALAGYLAARTAAVLGAALSAGLALWAALRFGPRVFPYPPALPLVSLPALPQCADLVGVEGLGAALLALSVLGVEAARRRCARRGAAVLLGVAGMLTYGALREAQVMRARTAAPTLAVALVQPAVGAALRWEPWAKDAALARLQSLSREGGAGADLVVWHEAAYPHELRMDVARDGEAAPAALPDDGPPLLFGAMARAGDDAHPRRFNIVFLRARGGRIAGSAAKRVLLPFGEYLPGLVWFRAQHAAATGGQGVSPGTTPPRISLGRKEIGVLNCFEDTVPEALEGIAGVDLLVNVTNDAWFAGSNNAQHVVAARWRAIELRRDLVRASNEGASGHIDARGRVVAQAPQGVMTVLRVTPRALRGVPTAAPFAMFWGPRAALVVLAVAWWQSRRRERSG